MAIARGAGYLLLCVRVRVRVRVRSHVGEQIETLDHAINELQHDAWKCINRLHELEHKDDLHRKRPKSLFGVTRGDATSEATEREICRQDYEEKRHELQEQLRDAKELRRQLEKLKKPDDDLRVDLPELVRPHSSRAYRAALFFARLHLEAHLR